MSLILVTGATSQIGKPLLSQLAEAGFQILATSRRALTKPAQLGLSWLTMDLQAVSNFPPQLEAASTLIHLAPVYVLPDFLQRVPLAKLSRMLVFSTTSTMTKVDSTSTQEQTFARRMLRAEKFVQQYCAERQIACTIFRPTLTYGLGVDNNVSLIARFIHRYRFFPLVGQGEGNRQPVHVADLAQATVAALENRHAYGRIYALGGAEVLTYRTMVERIFAALDRRPVILRIPAPVLRTAIQGLRQFQRFAYLTPGMADRMKQDMVFDITAAVHDFGYKPRPFKPLKNELISLD